MKAIYIRTSTEEQNPENQVESCKSMSDGEFTIYRDQQSAWKEEKERENFEILKKGIKAGKYQNLYVWDLDRIYRDRKKLIGFFAFCKMYNCKIHSFRQRWLEDLNKMPPPFDEIVHNLMLQIMGWLAEEESQKKSDRVKLAMRRKNGVLYSYKGAKWGKKGLSAQKKNLIAKLYQNNKNISLRALSKELGISVGAAHKYLSILKGGKTLI